MPEIHIGPHEPRLQAERWMTKIRMAPECGRVPLNSALSYPVPGEDTGSLLFFFYQTSGIKGLHVPAHPIARVTSWLPNLRITDFRQGTAEELFPNAGKVGFRGEGEYDSDVQLTLLTIYPRIVQMYPSEPAGEIGLRFLERFGSLVSAELKPYYEAMNPEFFSWARK